jgi:hypothetical protein
MMGSRISHATVVHRKGMIQELHCHPVCLQILLSENKNCRYQWFHDHIQLLIIMKYATEEVTVGQDITLNPIITLSFNKQASGMGWTGKSLH